MEDQKYLNDAMVTAPADVLILPMTEDLSPAITLATQLRDAGIRTQLYCEKKKFKQKLSYADKQGIPFAIFLGEDEISAGNVTVKYLAMAEGLTPEELSDMESEGLYKQVTLTPEAAIGYIQKILERGKGQTPIVDLGYYNHKYDLDKPL